MIFHFRAHAACLLRHCHGVIILLIRHERYFATLPRHVYMFFFFRQDTNSAIAVLLLFSLLPCWLPRPRRRCRHYAMLAMLPLCYDTLFFCRYAPMLLFFAAEGCQHAFHYAITSLLSLPTPWRDAIALILPCCCRRLQITPLRLSYAAARGRHAATPSPRRLPLPA